MAVVQYDITVVLQLCVALSIIVFVIEEKTAIDVCSSDWSSVFFFQAECGIRCLFQ